MLNHNRYSDSRFSISLITIISFCLWIPAHPTAATVKPEICNRRCGKVDIPHPFGIGANCFYNESFAIDCSNSHSPILKSLNLEVIEIPVNNYNWTGTVTVKTPVVTTCGDKINSTETRWSSPNMSGSPFALLGGYDMIFGSVGCEGYAVLYDETGSGVAAGCSSVCDSPIPKGLNRSECMGYGCCQTRLELSQFQGYTISVRVDRSSASCRSAFLITKEFYFGALNASSMAAIPVVLSWDIPSPPAHSSPDWSWLIYVGPSVGTLLLTCALLWLCWLFGTRKRRKESRLRAKYFKKRLKEEGSLREAIEITKLFTTKELSKATDNFNQDRVLGQGGQGTVFKGMLEDGQVVAIKKSRVFDESQWEQFINEVILLSQIKHRHIVRLIGCCLESKEPLVVYEFIRNGDLFEHIHNSTSEVSLTWQMRVKIAAETASAINYLHADCPTPIFHRDIKSSNILLDENYTVKVSDFGISKAVSVDQTHLTTRVRGTFGYFDPEYFRLNQFSDKSDVYSFGVVLVEFLTGQKPIGSSTTDGGGEEETSLVERFIKSMNDSALYDILDPIILEGNEKEDIMMFAELAKRCLYPRGVLRPTMKEVTMVLDSLWNKTSS